MILYCDGDSHVAGTELGDVILPEHPGFLPWGCPEQLSIHNAKWIERTFGNGDLSHYRKQQLEKIALLEKEKAFPNKIANKLNIEVVNAALGGSSIDAICRRTLSNLIQLKNRDTVVAVIGITDPWRFELPNSNSDDVPWMCVLPNNNVDYLKEVTKYMVLAEKNYHSLVRFYKNIITIKDFCKLNDIKLFFIERYPINDVEPYFENYKDYVNLKNYANFKADLNFMKIVATQNLGNVMCPAFHFNETVHEYISNKVIELLH